MKNKVLLNAIIGDICGSIYEFHPIKENPRDLIDSRCYFTDDTVHTIAIADAILNNSDNPDFSRYLRDWSRRYPRAGYGGMMRGWIWDNNAGPYGSYGNGSAMRVSACGWVVDNQFDLSEKSSIVTHNHSEGIKGALAIGTSIGKCKRLSDMGKDIDSIKIFIKGFTKMYYPDYDSSISLDDRRLTYKWNSTCQGSVPESIQCVLEADSYEDAIKLAISMGGDADTMACIAGSIAGVIWEKPNELVDFAYKKLPKEMISIVEDFDKFIKLDE
jgi:ADP-ribosylglycohydrolase